MAERDPTVIERMAKAHWESTGGQWPDMRSDRKDMLVEHMLAAVRELQDFAWQQNETEISDWLRDRANEQMAISYPIRTLADHERRAGGKGE